MSIMKTQYRNVGGSFPGLDAQRQLQNRLSSGTPFTEVTGDYNRDIRNILDWTADPRNIPQYYTGDTVAAFDPLQQQAHQAGVGAAGTYDALTQSLLSDYDAQLDPNSALNQQIAGDAAQATANAFFGAGTPGSARSQIASNIAAQDAIRDNRERALQNIGAQRAHLTGGADILNQIGDERRTRAQDVINEDIKRFNWAQLSPQQQQDRMIALLTAQAGLNQAEAEVAANQALFGGFLGDVQTTLGISNNQLLDDVFGFDPSGGGIFDAATGILGGGGGWSGVGDTVGNVIGGVGDFLGGFFNEGGMVPGDPMMDAGAPAPVPGMMDQGMGPMAPGGAPMAPTAIPMDSAMPEAPMDGIMGMSMVASEPMSAIDSVKSMAEAAGLEVKIKTKK